MNKMRYCPVCKEYTFEDTCKCGEKSIVNNPPRYSPDSRHAKYRRETRKSILQEEGLL